MRFGLNLLLWSDTLHDQILPILDDQANRLRRRGGADFRTRRGEVCPVGRSGWTMRAGCTACRSAAADNPIAPTRKPPAGRGEQQAGGRLCPGVGLRGVVGPCTRRSGVQRSRADGRRVEAGRRACGKWPSMPGRPA